MRAAFWWIDRWRASTAYTDMSMEQQGLYRNLLDEVWMREDHVIPEASLAKASGDPLAWQKHGAFVLQWMRKVPGGYTNDTALEVLVSSKKRADKQKSYRDNKRNSISNTAGNGAGNTQGSPSPSPFSVSVLRTPDQSQENGNGTTDSSAPPTAEALSPLAIALPDPGIEVFDYWKSVMGHPAAKFTDERKRLVSARLREGYGVDRIKRAIDGCKASPHNQGLNESSTVYDELTLICRSGSKLEFYEAKAGPQRPVVVPLTPREQQHRQSMRAAIEGGLTGDGTFPMPQKKREGGTSDDGRGLGAGDSAVEAEWSVGVADEAGGKPGAKRELP